MGRKTTAEAAVTRENILQATARIVHRQGLGALTLAAAAAEAGVSKGGLLYHFATKEALLQGMHEYVLAQYIGKLSARAAADLQPSGRWSRAYLAETMQQLDEAYELNAAFLVAAVAKPQLFTAIKDDFLKVQHQLEQDGLPPVVANVIKLAVDGLYYNELFGLQTMDAEQREAVTAYLQQLTKE